MGSRQPQGFHYDNREFWGVSNPLAAGQPAFLRTYKYMVVIICKCHSTSPVSIVAYRDANSRRSPRRTLTPLFVSHHWHAGINTSGSCLTLSVFAFKQRAIVVTSAVGRAVLRTETDFAWLRGFFHAEANLSEDLNKFSGTELKPKLTEKQHQGQ